MDDSRYNYTLAREPNPVSHINYPDSRLNANLYSLYICNY